MVPPVRSFFFLLICCLCAGAPRHVLAGQDAGIRVLVKADAKSVRLEAPGSVTVRDAASGRSLLAAARLDARATMRSGKIVLGDRPLGASSVVLSSDGTTMLSVDGRSFRGDIVLRARPSGILAINRLEVEDYVKGIAVREISHHWPVEALKAHAVVFRTYALYRKQETGAADYDVTADVFSQGYGGRAAERYRTSEAVDATRGEVLMLRGKLVPAFYSSTCGGATENVRALWPEAASSALAGVRCEFCKDSPHFRWQTTLSAVTLAERLAKKIKAGRVERIDVLGCSRSGRVSALKVRTDRGAVTIAARDFRMLVGADSIKSTDFVVNKRNVDFVFTGKGWGHGVGLCQWGAYAMAKQGADYGKILRYYFPGSELTRSK